MYINVHYMYGILLLIRFFAVITKYTVLDEQRREAKEENHNVKTLVASLVGLSVLLHGTIERSLNSVSISYHMTLYHPIK